MADLKRHEWEFKTDNVWKMQFLLSDYKTILDRENIFIKRIEKTKVRQNLNLQISFETK